MARDGLRTLVVAQKELTRAQYEDFEVITRSDYFYSLKTKI